MTTSLFNIKETEKLIDSIDLINDRYIINWNVIPSHEYVVIIDYSYHLNNLEKPIHKYKNKEVWFKIKSGI